jgi:hypothetical protein
MTVKFSSLLAFILMIPGILLSQEKEGDIRVESSASVKELIAQKIAFNKEQNSFPGYKIQIYYGSEKECYEIKDEFTSLFPDIPTSIIFSTPQWKLQVGEYRSRLEADKSIQSIKKEYPSAIVLATEIELE